jgi:hypothetical protein
MALRRMRGGGGQDEGKENKKGGKKEPMDPSSYMGALCQAPAPTPSPSPACALACFLTPPPSPPPPPQLYEVGLLTVTFPSHVSHAQDVQAPVMCSLPNPQPPTPPTCNH